MTDRTSDKGSNNNNGATTDPFRQRPLLSLPQILVLVTIAVAIYVGVDLNHRAQTGRTIRAYEVKLQERVQIETTRQVELMVTRGYVNSEDYVAAYARNEAGLILPGERRVVPLQLEDAPLPEPVPTATPDPAFDARSWQAWWRLLSDAPLPSR